MTESQRKRITLASAYGMGAEKFAEIMLSNRRHKRAKHKTQKMKLFKNIVKSLKEIYAEKKEKFTNASQQGYYLDQREAALKNLLDPKAKLSGSMRRRLMKQLGRPLDPSEGYTYTAPKPAGDKWFRRLMRTPMSGLIRMGTRAAHRVSGMQIKFDKASARQQRLMKQPLEYTKMVKQIVDEVIFFRIANVKSTETKQ